ncbi:hypothetical protein HYX16_05710 [Candidatus Woesearchaeota archaeon]|nr:hypothetical protein [Candidatus Woesearchaeota archaeon]
MKEGIFLYQGNIYVVCETKCGTSVYETRTPNTQSVMFYKFCSFNKKINYLRITDIFKKEKIKRLGGLEILADLLR